MRLIIGLILINFFVKSDIENNFKEVTLTSDNLISLKGNINEELISNVIYKLNILEKEDIYIYINSNGGDVKAGNKLIEAINFYKIKKKIYCIANYAASMAFIILQSCPNRFATTQAVLMQHQISLSIKNKKNNIESYFKYIENLENEIIDLQIKKIDITKEAFLKKIQNDWWLTGKQALKEKVVDNLVVVGCNINEKETYQEIKYETVNNVLLKVITTFSQCPLVNIEINKEYISI